MTDELVSRADFLQWKKNPVTKVVFSVFEEMAITVMEEMLNPTLISNPNGLLRLNELMGYRNALNEAISFEIIESEEIEDDSQGESTGI